MSFWLQDVYGISNLSIYYPVRTVSQPFLETDDLITKFSSEFMRMKGNFDSGINVHTAMVLSRAVPVIDVMREYKLYNTTCCVLTIIQDVINCCQLSSLQRLMSMIDLLAFPTQD